MVRSEPFGSFNFRILDGKLEIDLSDRWGSSIEMRVMYVVVPLSLLLNLLWGTVARARVPIPATVPLETELLEVEAAQIESLGLVRRDTIDPEGLTVPSLWWSARQFDDKLLDTWLAYPEARRVDLVVNRQEWSASDYLDRYQFVNHFGRVARDDGYNLRVFVRQQPQIPIAAYTCNFNAEPVACALSIDTEGRSVSLVAPQRNATHLGSFLYFP